MQSAECEGGFGCTGTDGLLQIKPVPAAASSAEQGALAGSACPPIAKSIWNILGTLECECGVAKGSVGKQASGRRRRRRRGVSKVEEEEKEGIRMAAVTLMQPGAQEGNDQYR